MGSKYGRIITINYNTAWKFSRSLSRVNNIFWNKLDFIQSGSVTERVGQAFEERARDLYEVVVFVGQ